MSKQLKPHTEAPEASLASSNRPTLLQRLGAMLTTKRVSAGRQATRRLCLEQLEDREVPAVFLGEAPIDDTPMSFGHDGMTSYEEVSVQLVPHASGVVVNNANVNVGEGVTIKVSTGTGGGTVLNDGALESLHDAYDILHGTSAQPLGTDHMTFNFQSRLEGAMAIHLKQLDPAHLAHGNVLIDGSAGRTTVAIPADGVIPWNPAVGIDTISVINIHEQGELNPLGLSGIDVRMYLATTPTDLTSLQTQEASLAQQLATANTALSTAQANASPAPIRSLPWSQGVNTANHTLGKLNAHPGQNLYAVHFSPDGSRFVTAGQDKVAKIWNSSTGALERTLTGSTSLVIDAVWSTDGQSVWTTGYDKHVRQYSASTGAVQWDSGDLGAMALSAAMSSDGTTLTVSMNGAAPKVINTQTKAVNALGSGLIWTGQMTAMNDGNVMMFVNTNAYRSGNYALIVNPATRQTVWQSNVIGGQLNAIAATPDGQWIVAGDDAGGLTVWKRSTNQQMFTLPNQGTAITSMAITSGNVLLVGSGNQLSTFDLRTLANNQAPIQGQTYASTGGNPRSITVSKDVAMFTSGDGGASGLIAEDLRVAPGYQDTAAAVNAAQTQVNSLTTQLADTRAQIAVLQGQEVQRSSLVQVLDAKTIAETQDRNTVNALTQRMTALSEWTLAGKTDRLHALADRGNVLTQAAADVRDELAILEAQLSSDPAFYGALQDQAQQHVATLFGLSEQWSTLQAEFDAVDWTKLSPKTLERLFPGSVEQSQTTFSVVQTSGNTVTLAIGGTGPMSVALQHGDAYLGSRTINTMPNPPAFQTVTLMLDRTTASGPQTVNLLSATGTVISTVTLNWNKDMNTLSVADNANVFTPQGMAKDLGTMTYQELLDTATIEEATQTSVAQQSMDANEAATFLSGVQTSNIVQTPQSTGDAALQREQILHHTDNLDAAHVLTLTQSRFLEAFYRTFPEWVGDPATKASGWGLNRSLMIDSYHTAIYNYNVDTATMADLGLQAVLAIRRGQDPTTIIAQMTPFENKGTGPLGQLGIRYPTVAKVLESIEIATEQQADTLLADQQSYQLRMANLEYDFLHSSTWGGTGANTSSSQGISREDAMRLVRAAVRGQQAALARGDTTMAASFGRTIAQAQTIYNTVAAGIVVPTFHEQDMAIEERDKQLADNRSDSQSYNSFNAPLHAAAGNLNGMMLDVTSILGASETSALAVPGNTRTTPETLSLRQNNLAVKTFTVTEDVMANFWVNAPLTNIGGVVTYRNLSITISGHNLIKSYPSNHATNTAGESISLKLTPGEYTVTVVDLTNYGTQSSPQAPAFTVPLGVDIQRYLKTKIIGRVSTENSTQTMPVSLSVAEFSTSGQRKESSEVHPLDPSKPVWVVIHGMDSSDKSNSILALAKAFAGYQNIQVVTLNWEEAAKDGFVTSFDSGDVRWAPAVGQWVARQLMAAGFSPGSINIAGHSHGSYVGFEMATEIQRITKGDQINSFVAMDAAGNAPIWSGYDHTKINFANVSKNAMAFDGAYALSSDSLTGTADVSFRIKTNSSVSIADQHGLSVTAFANILEHERGSPGALSNYLSLGNLMASADSNKQKYQPNVLGEVFEGDIYVDVEDRQGIGGTYKNATPKGIMMKQIGDDAFDWIDINS